MLDLLRFLRNRQFSKLLADQSQFYDQDWTADSILQWQLCQFNQLWQNIYLNVSGFRDLKRNHSLPENFSSWSEFSESLPIMDKHTLQTHRQQFTDSHKKIDYWRSTGGSTGEPIQIPSWNSEKYYSQKDIWHARSWFGVKPSDKLFLIWGHSHLLGTGFKGWFNGRKRNLSDFLLGYNRFSAYDLSENALKLAADQILQFKPDYLISYSVALDRFAFFNQEYRDRFHKLNLKVAIATAESFPRSDSADYISDILGCPVIMEYGCVETGPIAYQRSAGTFLSFWRHFYIEGLPSSNIPNFYEILVTCLYPRAFPLVRYKLGDLISVNFEDSSHKKSYHVFDSVVGRCNDFIQIKGGNVIHSEVFSHVIRDINSVRSFQVVQEEDGQICFRYSSSSSMNKNDEKTVRLRLAKIHNDLGQVPFIRVEKLQQTISGKVKTVISHKGINSQKTSSISLE